MAVHECLILADVGTTNTRLWLVSDGNIVSWLRQPVGIRDSATDGNSARLRDALQDGIRQLCSHAGNHQTPTAVLGAGMLTSSLGLTEIPHLEAPVTVADLAGGIRRCAFPDITPLPVYLVPGVRNGLLMSPAGTIGDADMMRGEETLCMGLLHTGVIRPGDSVLNLGSHWKLIQTTEAGDIAGSISTISGELIHTVQSSTVLAASLPSGFPETFDLEWVKLGLDEQRRSGLSRALYCVRLLDVRSSTGPDQRIAYCMGAFIGEALAAFLTSGRMVPDASIAIIGPHGLATGWSAVLKPYVATATVIESEQVEICYVQGLLLLFLMLSRKS